MIQDERPLMVTIRCITYNHEPYIRQCLEGFVMQKTNFRFEAVVHDDASTDGTAAIILEYAEKYPDIIKPIIETENLYSKHDGSLDRIMDEHTQGKYIAICEGDDYWTDSLKLQKQVEFMETHTDCALCHTGFTYLYQKIGLFEESFLESRRNLQLLQNTNNLIPYILDGNQYRIQTCSVLYRNESYKKIENLYNAQKTLFLMGDTQLWCFLNTVGNICFLDESMCVYRLNEGSATISKSIRGRKFFDLSSSKMRVYMSRILKRPEQERQKFEDTLKQRIMDYALYDKSVLEAYHPLLSYKERMLLRIREFYICKNLIFLRDKIKFSGKYTTLKRKIKRLPDYIYKWTNRFFINIPSKTIRAFYLNLFVGDMGHDVFIGKGLIISMPSHIFIGNNVVINEKVRLDGRRYINIGNNVDIAAESAVWTLHHDYNDDYHKTIGGTVKIEDYSWLCYRSVILPKCVIGYGAVVASCAVVTKNVPSKVVVGGVPARFLSRRESKLLYRLAL